jgi:ABC-type multidrug transport system fused ATPase/permease subunit
MVGDDIEVAKRARLRDVVSSRVLVARALWRATPGWSTVAAVCAVVGAAASAVLKLAAGHLLAELPAAIKGGSSGQVWSWFAVFGVAIVGSELLTGLQMWASHAVSARFLRYTYDLVAETGVAPRGIELLDQPGYAGRLDALVGFTRSWQFFSGLEGFWAVLGTRLSAIGSLVLIMQWRWWPGLIVTAAFFAMTPPFTRWVDATFNELAEADAHERRRARYIRDLMTHSAPAKELRLFGWSGWLANRYRRTWLAATAQVWQHSARRYAPAVLASIAVSGACVAGTLVLLAHDAVAGTVGAAGVIIVVQAVLGLNQFGPLGDASTGIRRIGSVLQRLIGLRAEVGLPDLRPANAATETIIRGAGAAEVRIDDVSFTYPTRDAVTLNRLSLHIPPGQSVAIVGVNGAGKSTLIKLLAGLYVPDSGAIRISGGDPYTDESTRQRVAVIFQDFVRYPLTLRENVGFGALVGGDDQRLLNRALYEAGGADVLDRVGGWDTVLSAEYAGGTSLSGGQWQRVALARALAAVGRGAGVLVLDEPTAALDVRAEAALFDRFLEVTRGVTTILVSHRLSSVRHADRIVVLDGNSGRIVEDGTHNQLLDSGGAYARMFALQARRFAEAGGMADALSDEDGAQ